MQTICIIALLLLICATSTVWAQGETDYWYFGAKAGLRFSAPQSGIYPPPQALNNSRMPETWEPCAVASDANGTLLFYTNGLTVWNANHVAMAGNTDNQNPPWEDKSSSQGALIVRRPGAGSIYYVFAGKGVESVTTVGQAPSFSYRTVDMSLNGGLGGVITPEIVLQKDGSAFKGTEKMQAVEHENGRDIWVLLHEWHTNAFCAYLVTPTGVSATPVVSPVGSVHVLDISTNTSIQNDKWQAAGCMKIAPRRTSFATINQSIARHWLAVAIPGINPSGQSVPGRGVVELFGFDPATGSVSAPLGGVVQLDIANYVPYGVEFSPRSNTVYVTASGPSVNSQRSQILLQYNLEAFNIPSSREEIATGSTASSWENGWKGLQLARDGKIYMANSMEDHLGVIHFPNTIGANCGFTTDGPELAAGSTSRFTLPNFMNSFLSDIGREAVRCDVCEFPVGSGQEVPWGALQNFAVSFTYNSAACTLRVYYRKRTCNEYQDIKLVAIKRETFGSPCDDMWNGRLTNPDGSSSSAQEFLVRWAGDELLRDAADYYGLNGTIGSFVKVRFFRSPFYSSGDDPACADKWLVGYDARRRQSGVVELCCFTTLELLRCTNDDYQTVASNVYPSPYPVNIASSGYYRDPDLEGVVPCGSPWVLGRYQPVRGCYDSQYIDP